MRARFVSGINLVIGLATCCGLSLSPAHGASTAPNAFDGRWSVVLVCPDTTDRKGLVKGYDYAFVVSVRDGVLEGAYGAPGRPASVTYAGTVAEDGTLEIVATGNTGSAEYSVGSVARGTRYGYTLQGRLVGATGQATRREVRPCSATFTRSGPSTSD